MDSVVEKRLRAPFLEDPKGFPTYPAPLRCFAETRFLAPESGTGLLKRRIRAMTKKFKFKFQILLDVEKRREDAVRIDLAKLKNDLAETQQLIALREGMLRARQCELREKQLSSLPPCSSSNAADAASWTSPPDASTEENKPLCSAEIQYYQSYFSALQKEITQERRRASEINEQIAIVREKLLDLSRKMKMLEKLQEKQKEDFSNLLNAEERKFLDEITFCKLARQPAG